MELRVWLMAGVALLASDAAAQCRYHYEVDAGQTYDIKSPCYPNSYPGGMNCFWQVTAPSRFDLILKCQEFYIQPVNKHYSCAFVNVSIVLKFSQSENCKDGKVLVSLTGDTRLSDGHKYCGSGTFTLKSKSNQMTMQLTTQYFSKGAFRCTITATRVQTHSPPKCDCGWKKQKASAIPTRQPGGRSEKTRSTALDGVEEDARKLGCKNWKAATQDRDGWRQLLREAQATKGCSANVIIIVLIWTRDNRLFLYCQSRIVNGTETGVNEYPMMVGLVHLVNEDVFGGGTIIAKRYVLTAAHALLDRPVNITGVLVGDHDISTGKAKYIYDGLSKRKELKLGSRNESLSSKETLRGHSDSSFRGEGYIQCCVGVRLCEMYSNQELAEIHFMYGKADGNAALARRLYQERYPQRQCPDRKTFGTTKIYNSRSTGGWRLNMTPSISTRRVALQVNVPHTTVWRLLKEYQLYPYHLQRVQALSPADYPARVRFCQWFLQQCGVNPNFPALVLFTDEAQFTRDGITNFHNQHVWAYENPRSTVPSHHQVRFSLNMWAGIIGDRLVEPHVLVNRLTGQAYTNFLENTIPHVLEDTPLINRQHIHFLHDGAPAHFSRTARRYLDRRFPDRWIGRGGPIAWPPRSPDLNPLGFYLWGHLKSLVYSSPVPDLESLRNRIVACSEDIRNTPGVWDRVRRSMRHRCEFEKCPYITGDDTSSAKILLAESFQSHPDYNSDKQMNDIAVIRVDEDIIFSSEVGPACLPFRFPNINVGAVVTVLGWGTTQQGGPKSDVLLQTELYIIPLENCTNTFGSKVTSNHICTFNAGTDACQADSGGPVLWSGPGNRLHLLAVISYGRGCALGYPGVNTRVYPYINWILDVSPGT
ncbi:hypothetical protein ANN_14065 [Periplaneta americana]|uniref:Uncharacterized protein n=1 Tax=Periplaneta americana TaxID=6978 RepID=A0ABQ8SWH7_PERAM|nr:hypothetical protein ANN_14065 [Periplaneta americana]